MLWTATGDVGCAAGSSGGGKPATGAGAFDGSVADSTGTSGTAGTTGAGGAFGTAGTSGGGVTGTAGTSAPGTAGSGFPGAAGTGTTGSGGASAGSSAGGSTGTAGAVGTGGRAGSTGVGGASSAGRGGSSGGSGGNGSGGSFTGAGGGAGSGTAGVTGTAGTTGAAGSSIDGGAGDGGVACGGAMRTACGSNSQFCELPTGACATVNPSGFCLSKPPSCPDTLDPVCGCNGKSYANDCERQAAGVSKWTDGLCSASTCPATPPQSGAACTQGDIACVYAITTGSNAGCVERFSCAGGVWSAPVVVCPA